MSRRTVLRGAAAVLPGAALAVTAGTPAAAAPAGGPVHGAFCAPGYSWPAATTEIGAAVAVSGVVFTLTAGGLPLAGRRVRFSLSAFEAVGRSVWFSTPAGRGPQRRLGYLDLDTDAAGAVALDRWLRRGAVPTTALGARPVLRAQLIGAETVLASARLSVV